MKRVTCTFLTLAVYLTAIYHLSCDNPFSSSLNNKDDEEPVVYTQADVCGTWKFSMRSISYEAEYDADGDMVSSTMEPNAATAPASSLSISENGEVYGKYVRSGGSGATIWTRTDSFSGQMSKDKQSMTGINLYRRTGTSGVSEAENEMTAEKIEECAASEGNS